MTWLNFCSLLSVVLGYVLRPCINKTVEQLNVIFYLKWTARSRWAVAEKTEKTRAQPLPWWAGIVAYILRSVFAIRAILRVILLGTNPCLQEMANSRGYSAWQTIFKMETML